MFAANGLIVMKKIFVHCGIHKTGTTALQTAFMQKSGVLRQRGILYPKTGRLDTLGGGHHNIAWEVSRDRRFVPHLGDITKLVEEIDAFSGNVVLSSEDFESALLNSSMMRNFIQRLGACNAEIYIVFNVRNQLSYCQSLFAENLGQNIGEEYMRYVDEITRNGHFRIKEWVFHFDYMALIESLSSLPVQLIVRNFHALVKQSSIADFLDLIELDDENFKEHIGYRSNERPPLLDAIKNFCVNRFNRPPGDREIMCIRTITGMIGGRKLINLPSTKTMFRDAFMEGNRKICEQFGFAVDGLDLPVGSSETGVYYERLFSFELQCLILKMRNLMIAGQRQEAERSAEAFVAAATA